MNGIRSLWVAGVVVACISVNEARAQSFLQRLGEQLNQQLTPSESRETLPPPRETDPALDVSRAPLGIRVAPVTEQMVREQKLIVRRGAVITAIEKGSAADRAGLPLGSAIVALDGRRIDSPDDLLAAIQASRPGSDVELTYYDRNKLVRKKVHLAAVPARSLAAAPEQPIPPPPALTPAPPAAPPAPVPSNLDRPSGAGGARPLLGRLGRVIDNFATQAQAVTPEPSTDLRPADSPSEVAALRQQLSELAKEVAALREQVSSLEKKLSSQK